MAKLRAHGTEIGTLYGLTVAKRYMADGHVLKNIGFGWKLHAKVKPGSSPQEAFSVAKEKHEAKLAARPCLRAYQKALFDMAGLSKRWKLHAAVSTMPDDCDGVWSEACDGYGDNISADVDEVGELCRLYKNAIAESDTMKQETAAA
jgi:hypothetical protein